MRVRLLLLALATGALAWLVACAPAPQASSTAAPPTTAPTLAALPANSPTVARPTATATPTLTSTAARPTLELPTATSVPTSTPAPTATRTPTPAIFATDAPRAHVPAKRFDLNKGKYPNALCNDGSIPVFFFRRGYGSGANKWVVFFKGGGACYDTATCTNRDKNLVSSTGLGDRSIDNDGIASDDPAENPDFYSWNHVLLPYCSSDWYSGASPDNNNPMHFYFRGHYIVDAVVDSISDAGTLGAPTLREATQILFVGSSAGGIGVRVNLDRLAKSLSWADVRGVEDALMVVPTNPAFTQQDQDQRGIEMMTLYKPVLDESCATASAARPWLCLEYAFAVTDKQIATPLFIRQDQYDPVNLEWQQLDPKSPQDRQTGNAAAIEYNKILNALPAAFGTSTSVHIVLETAKFNTDKEEGLTFAQVLGNWYFNRSGPKLVIAPLRK